MEAKKMNKQDFLVYAIVIVLAVMLVAYLVAAKNGPAATTSASDMSGMNMDQPDMPPINPASGAPSSATAPAPAPTTTTAPKALTYQQALTAYAGYRIQFVSCHGSPGTLNLTVGKKFMLDNRDAKSHLIDVGKVGYRLGADGFAIATAPWTAGTYGITCDGGGAAQLTVQK
jgi:hypothetical protein